MLYGRLILTQVDRSTHSAGKACSTFVATWDLSHQLVRLRSQRRESSTRTSSSWASGRERLSLRRTAIFVHLTVHTGEISLFRVIRVGEIVMSSRVADAYSAIRDFDFDLLAATPWLIHIGNADVAQRPVRI